MLFWQLPKLTADIVGPRISGGSSRSKSLASQLQKQLRDAHTSDQRLPAFYLGGIFPANPANLAKLAFSARRETVSQ